MDRSGIMDRHKVRYHGQVYGEYLVVTEYYRLNNKTNFLSKHFNFFKAVQTFNSGWYPGRIMYVYEKMLHREISICLPVIPTTWVIFLHI